MKVISSERLAVLDESHIVIARNRAAQIAKKIGLGITDQTKLATATSELARNMIRYAQTGAVVIEHVETIDRVGVRVTFLDKGPGIADISTAMRDGWSSSKGMGLGLPGSKRLVNEFYIESTVGVGTTIVILKWNRY